MKMNLPPTVTLLSLPGNGSGPFLSIPKGASAGQIRRYALAVESIIQAGEMDRYNVARNEIALDVVQYHPERVHPFLPILLASFNDRVLEAAIECDFWLGDFRYILEEAKDQTFLLARMLADWQPVETDVTCVIAERNEDGNETDTHE